MTSGLEQRDQELKSQRTLLVNSLQWSRSEEAGSKKDLWQALAVPTAMRRGVARTFADSIRGLDGISGIWITDLASDLDIAIALDDMELESQIRNAFIDLVCERLDPSEGELFVFPSDSVPDWAQNGTSLT